VNSTFLSQRPVIIGVGGFTSEVGKTTLMCDLLQSFPGWEAIKTTRGHYRSCGKDPHACCVSDLLEEKAVIRSGKELTYKAGKDTGRYWDAGASNVHWVVATDEQVDEGINNAFGRVKGQGVFVEGNSFSKFLEPDYFVMVVRADDLKIKRTAREVCKRVSAFYVSGEKQGADEALLATYLAQADPGTTRGEVPIYYRSDLMRLIASIGVCAASLAA
jgi:molybdopterin-guanine dinucleotide biosynthesis protein